MRCDLLRPPGKRGGEVKAQPVERPLQRSFHSVRDAEHAKQKGRPKGRPFPISRLSALLAGGFARRRRFRLLLGLEVLAGLLVDDLHRQADLAALVEAEQLDLDLVAFLDDVGGLVDALAGELADVDEAVLGAEEVHEGAEVDRS